jgi:hypothetical protein
LKVLNKQNNQRNNEDRPRPTNNWRILQHAFPIPGLFEIIFKPSLYIAVGDILRRGAANAGLATGA